jgi:GNAT superfamily N-acetyltransferase
MIIRPATTADNQSIWAILAPTIRAGETYPLPRDLGEHAAIAYWTGPTHEVFVAEDGEEILGTYYIRPNQAAGGAHIANCGYMTATAATGRGIATAMGAHSLTHAKSHGYRAIQFNFVISTNTRAIALWTRLGFATLCRLPEAFHHPTLGFVDALVMFQTL